VSEEHYWLQHGAAGDFLVVASDSDQTKYMQILANPETDFNRWMRQQIEQIFGRSSHKGAPPTPSRQNWST
jgi:hypothetical protein